MEEEACRAASRSKYLEAARAYGEPGPCPPKEVLLHRRSVRRLAVTARTLLVTILAGLVTLAGLIVARLDVQGNDAGQLGKEQAEKVYFQMAICRMPSGP